MCVCFSNCGGRHFCCYVFGCAHWMCIASLAACASVGDCLLYNCVILMVEHWPTVWGAGCRGLHSNPSRFTVKAACCFSCKTATVKNTLTFHFTHNFIPLSTDTTYENLLWDLTSTHSFPSLRSALSLNLSRWELTCRCWWRRGWRWKRCTASHPWSLGNHRRWCPGSTPHPGTKSRDRNFIWIIQL